MCPDDTSPEYRKKLYFYKETYRQRRAEIGVSLSDSNEELGNKCFFDRNLIDYWHNSQNICMSFTKYVEFVEKYNQPAEQA